MTESERIEHDRLPVVHAGDLDDFDADQRWLVEPLWARAGVGILGGTPKSHKSWIGLNLALSVPTATPFLGRFAVRDRGPVMIYFAEDAPGVIKQRLPGLCAPRGLDLDALPTVEHRAAAAPEPFAIRLITSDDDSVPHPRPGNGSVLSRRQRESTPFRSRGVARNGSDVEHTRPLR